VQFNKSLLSNWSAAERRAAAAERSLISTTASGTCPSPKEIELAKKLRLEAVELMHQVLEHLDAVASAVAAQTALLSDGPATGHLPAESAGERNRPAPGGTITVGSGVAGRGGTLGRGNGPLDA
jgi:hypothetical protein